MRLSDLTELENRIRLRQRQLDALSGQKASQEGRKDALEKEILALQEEVATFEKSGILLSSIGEERQVKAQDTIEQLVTRGLQQIFDDSYSFHIVQKTKANAASVEFVVRTTLAEGVVVDTPVMDARGGGLAATIGFLLRVVILLLRDGSRGDNILVIDESFSHVSAEYLPGVSEFLRELVEKTELQIIMVTHQEELTEAADTVYRFTTKDGKTVVTEL